MGLPVINIIFEKKAATLINRSGRGVVVLILKDSTKTQVMTPYRGIDEVAEDDWTSKNYEYIKMAFDAEPDKVLCVRAKLSEENVNVSESLAVLNDINVDYLTSPEFKKADGDVVKAWLKKRRDAGKKVKVLIAGYEADYEAMINFGNEKVTVLNDQDEVTEYSAQEYCCRLAGVLAAIPLTQSSTYYELPEIVDTTTFEDPDKEADEGKLIIIYDGDAFKIGRGVTSLITISDNHPKDFKKIKVLEGADIIRYDIYSTFKENFVGKLNNTYDNKQNFIGAINQYLKNLEDTVVDKENDHYVELNTTAILNYLKADGIDTDDLTEQQIKEANTGSNIFLAGKVKLLDAMEDLDLLIRL